MMLRLLGVGVCLVGVVLVFIYQGCFVPSSRAPGPARAVGAAGAGSLALQARPMETCDGAQFASPEALAIAPDCEPQGCGVNGAWLGQQLKFRELHLQPGQENQQRLAITSFTGADGERLRLGFAPDKLDEVVGYPARGEPVRGAQLRGA